MLGDGRKILDVGFLILDVERWMLSVLSLISLSAAVSFLVSILIGLNYGFFEGIEFVG